MMTRRRRGLDASQAALAKSARRSGHSWTEIAVMVGATVGQVRYAIDPTYTRKEDVRAEREPPRRDPIVLLVDERTLRTLEREAQTRGLETKDFAASLLKAIAGDGLFDAVLG